MQNITGGIIPFSSIYRNKKFINTDSFKIKMGGKWIFLMLLQKIKGSSNKVDPDDSVMMVHYFVRFACFL